MARISGVDIPDNKTVFIGLTKIYGIGQHKSTTILKEAGIDPNLRIHKLTPNQIAKIQKIIDKINTEGNLRKLVRDNIQRLKRIGSYRGLRHTQNLPVRGQRTRTNARTKRGRRMTIGALSKEMAQKVQEQQSKK